MPKGSPKMPVVCLENGVEYPSQLAASKALGVNAAYVSLSVRRGTTMQGYTFKKVGEKNATSPNKAEDNSAAAAQPEAGSEAQIQPIQDAALESNVHPIR